LLASKWYKITLCLKKEASSLLKKFFTAVLAFVLMATAASGAKIYAPEDAMPAVPGDEEILVVKISDARSLPVVAPFASYLAEELGSAGEEWGAAQMDIYAISKALSFFGKARDFLDASESLALLAASGSAARFYASLSVSGERFDKLAAGKGPGRVRLEKWNAPEVPAGAEGWALKSSAPETPGGALYMTRVKAGARGAVNIASDKKAAGEMAAASKNPEKRLRISRKTDGENFVRISLLKPFETNGEKKGFSPGRSEISWNVTDGGLNVRSNLEMLERAAERVAAGRVSAGTFSHETVPILGNGELVTFASVDPALFLYAALPNEPEPIKFAAEQCVGFLPSLSEADLESVLKNCRISAAVVAKGETPDAAYMVLETEAGEAVDRLFEAFAALLDSPVSLSGWDSAFEFDLGQGLKAVAAKKGGMFLVGLGERSSFGRRASIPADIIPPPDASGGLGFAMTRRLLSLRAPWIEGTLEEALEENLGEWDIPEELRDFLRRRLDELDRFVLTQSSGGGGEMNITLKERSL
jgi:hypothetical protein